MQDVEADPQLADVTAEMAWVRRLAARLLRDDDVDDVAQETWLVGAERRPSDGRPLRPWLHRVALNLVRMKARARQRREVREAATGLLAEPPPSPDDLVQRVELQRIVAGEVLKLAEPYRSTVLLHYFEELSCAEIARRLELPEGTVRRRLKVALDELRARIDATERKSGGLAALAPLAGLGASSRPIAPLAVRVIAMKKLIAGLVVLLLLILAAVWWSGRDRARDADGTVAAERARAIAAAGAGAAEPGSSEGRLPAWLTQPGVKPRRIAGRVTFRGAPVGGATVELASIASESGLASAPRRTANAAGEFDFGPQGAMEWSVRASAPGKASASAEIDLRDPGANPAPDHLEIELGACDAAMAGTIRDASGGPIDKARVARLLSGHPTGVPGGASVVSDDQGHYELCVEARWPGWTVVEVSADGYAAIRYRAIVPGRVKADFALVPEAAIVGRVVRDDTGGPIPQAYVFVPPGATPRRGAFTDSSGRFRLDGVTAGRHLVFARADGMAESSRGTPVVIGVAQTSVEIEIRLEAGSTIRGSVVDHGKPVVGARVAALDGSGARTGARSQEDGSFALTGVPRGDVRFTALPYEVVTPSTFRVTQPLHDGVTIEVESRGAIIGHVVRGKDPVPGANLDIHGPNDGELEEIRADATGRFEARGLRPGPWTLFASDDRLGAFGRAPETVHLGRGETAEVTIDLAFAASISGRVVDQAGAPVPGVTVVFRNLKSDDAGITSTSTDGTFRAATMTGGGEYRPAVTRNLLSRESLPPASGSEFPLVALADGQAQVTGVVLAVHLDHLTIAGTVVDSAGAPVPDARIVAIPVGANQGWRAPSAIQDPADTTTVDGRFSIGDLLDGTYALRARSPAGVEATLTGIPAGRTDVSLVLPAPGSLEVTVAGFKSAPQVGAVPSGGAGSNAPLLAAPQGALYVLRNLSPGSYVVTASTPSEAATTVVQVVAGQTARATLTSGSSGVVAGRVRDFRSGKPVEGMTCRALPRVGLEPAAVAPGEGTRTDAQGAFVIAAAPAGQIVVSCGGLWRNYSDGARLVTLAPAQRADLDVPVVAWSEEPGTTLGGIGAELEDRVLVPQLVRVQPAGPAGTGGFHDGDLVVTVDGASVTELSPHGVWALIVNRSPGTKVKLGVTRAGKSVTGEITLGDAPQ